MKDTTTLYARVPEDLKRRVDDYARAGGKSIAAAVAELLEDALRTVRDELTLAKRVDRLEAVVFREEQ
jgi:predicted DNA-binding protein